MTETPLHHEIENQNNETDITGRRGFLKSLGKAAVIGTAAAGALSVQSRALAQEALNSRGDDGEHHDENVRTSDAYNYRRDMAQAERISIEQSGNGDEGRYSDFSGNYSKGLLHNNLGIPNGAAYLSLR